MDAHVETWDMCMFVCLAASVSCRKWITPFSLFGLAGYWWNPFTSAVNSKWTPPPLHKHKTLLPEGPPQPAHPSYYTCKVNIYRRRIEKVQTKVLFFILHQHLHMKTEAASDFIIRTWKICQHPAVLQTAPFFSGGFVFTQCVWKKGEASRILHLNLYIDNSLTFAQLSVSLRLASASSLFSRLWLRSLSKALTHTLLCAWSRWTPTPARHHGSWLLAGSDSMTRRPLSEYQSAASLSM